MPAIAEQWVPRSPVLLQLDRYINDDDNRASYARALANGESPAFVAGGPFADSPETQDHWMSDWIDSNGRGGSYWPYATDVDIATLVKNGLSESVQTAVNTEKIHNTLWICSGDAPEQDQPVSPATQQQLFKVAVHESDQVVTLIILTPQPA
jgi:hypothetical protein